MVDIVLYGHKLKAVVDTAAQVSMISVSKLESLGFSLSTRTHEQLLIKNAEHGSFMNCFSLPNVEFVMAERQYSHSFAAGPITDDIILGLDFWLKHQAVIDLLRQQIEMNGYLIPIGMVKMNGGDWFNVSQVSVAADLVVEPYQRTLLAIQLLNPVPDFVTTSFSTQNILGPIGIINGKEKTSWIEVINDSGERVRFKSGDIVTSAVELHSICVENEASPSVRRMEQSLDKDGIGPAIQKFLADDSWDTTYAMAQKEECVSLLPEHLKEMFRESCENLETKQQYALGKLLIEYQDVFATSDADLGSFDLMTHSIHTHDEIPVQDRLRRTPMKFAHEEEKALKQMLDHGIIEPSSSNWSSAPVLVRKKDGSVRYAIDYRKLNSKTIRDTYPLPLIHECIDALQGSLWFHALDLASGYWQVHLNSADAHKTAFVTKYGLFQFQCMPFGLCNAPATFQRVMHLVLRGMVWKQALVYLDDVIVLGSSFSEALLNLAKTLERFRQHQLKLKPKKCQLFRSEVKFLGRRITKNTMQISDEHVQSIEQWPIPSNGEDLLKFLGFVNYHREFIPNLSEKAEPLFALTKKGATFHWDEDCRSAFQQLKEDILEQPKLSLPNDKDPYVLDTDASNFAIGSCLYQVREGKEYPISFASHTLTPAQRKYCTTRKELLAIVVFTRHFKHYLLGRQFTVRTDHGSLAWLYRFKEPTGQLGRWLEELAQYDMVIQHRPGVQHTNADALSRIPETLPYCNCYEAGKKLEQLPCGGCNYCSRLHQQWQRFNEDVDYVVPLAVRHIQVSQSSENVEADGDSGITLTGYSAQELHHLQSTDAELGILLTWLDGDPPSPGEIMQQGRETKALWKCRDQLVVRDGVLFYNWLDEMNQGTLKLVVPAQLRDEVISLAHDGVVGGHWGRDKTIRRVRERFFWQTVDHDVTLFVRTCATCNTMKHQKKNRAKLTSFHAGIPNERVHLDFLGPFVCSSQGNKYILSIVDQFTKWIEIYALPDQSAQITAKVFFEGWITRFGVPLQVHTDQGRNFTSNLFSDLCRLLDSTKTRTTPYRPSANGQVERYNQMILAYIRCQLEEDQSTWDEHLSVLGLSLRSTVNRNTGFTPNMLQLGREVTLPLDILFGLSQTKEEEKGTAEYLRELDQKMRCIFALTRKTLQASQLRQKVDYDTRGVIREHAYEVGDLIYLLNSTTTVGMCAKLQPTMLGPYVVCDALSQHLYRVKGRKHSFVVHQDRMKLCEDRAIPLWVRRTRDEVLGCGEPVGEEEPIEPLTPFFTLELENEQEVHPAELDSPTRPDRLAVVESDTHPPKEVVTRAGRHIHRPARFFD